jgi:pyruvate/2-oxoacid:ferredoxin oxidoreductase alpha subunit/ferredoxin
MNIPDIQFGSTVELSPANAAGFLEAGISEGILLSEGTAPVTSEHVFGRKPAFFNSNALSFMLGVSSNGLRTAAISDVDKLAECMTQIRELNRQHLPSVLLVKATSGDSSNPFPVHQAFYQLAESGGFQLMASNVQEVVDFALIAHKIAELALVPGMVGFDHRLVQPVHLPEKRFLRRFLGEPDDSIDSPTPAQEIIFGEKRRRIPNWFNFDFPVLQGAIKDTYGSILEFAAQQQYFQHHLPEIVKRVLSEYGDLTGRKYEPLATYKCDDADFVILSQGAVYRELVLAVDRLRSTEKIKVGCANLSLLRPAPIESIARMLNVKKAVTLLESLGANPADASALQHACQAGLTIASRAPQIVQGYYACPPTVEDLVLVFKNMADKARKLRFYLGFDFTKATGAYPQQDILLQTIKRKYPGIESLSLGTSVSPAIAPSAKSFQEGLPLLIRRHQNLGPAYAHLSRFYHDTTSFYQTGEQRSLVADPFQALPVMPASTANMAGMAGQRTSIPVIEMERCTACGECFVQCPHAAMPTFAIGLESLIKAGMSIASSQGVSTSQLTPLVKNLAKVAAQSIKDHEGALKRVGDFLPAAFEKLAVQMKLDGEKLQFVTRDFEALLSVIARFQVSVNDRFFNEPEQMEKGSGQLFSIAIDPFACTACGICAEVCPEEAITLKEQTEEILYELTGQFSLWEQLPDTPASTIDRLHHRDDFDSFAALMLSRNFYLSMSGGSFTEEGTHAKTTLHLLIALTESIVQPRILELVKETDVLVEELSANIQHKMSEALPKETSAALWKAVAEASGKKIRLEEIISEVAKQEQSRLVDTAVLQRKIKLVNDLKELRWLLTEGVQGGGRSRLGLSISGEAAPWANAYPFNAFTSPVFMADGLSALESAMGIMQGYLRHMLDNLRLMRRAKLEVSDKYNPEFHDAETAALEWDLLTEEEKRILPPLLVVCDKKQLLSREFSKLNAVLCSELPVKFVVLDDGNIDPQDDTAAMLSYGNSLMFTASALRNCFVFQGSLADRKHLFDGLLKGMKKAGPALFLLNIPEYANHDTERISWSKLPILAINSRVAAHFSFDPSAPKHLLSSASNLDSTPSSRLAFHHKMLEYQEGTEQKRVDYAFTYADWLFTLKGWSSQFRLILPKEEDNAMPLADYLALPEGQQNTGIPVVFHVDAKGTLAKHAVSRKVIAASKASQLQWNTLRELAGTVSAHPEKLRADVEAEIKLQYEAQLTAVKADYEEQLRKQEVQFMEGVRLKLKEKLLWLSKQRTSVS